MGVNIGIKDAHRKAVIDVLNQLLADEFILYTKTLNYHWNVTGKDFYELHEFFGKLYKELAEVIDDVAERARALGGRAAGTLEEFLKLKSLSEESEGELSAPLMISSLLNDHETIIRNLRKSVDDCANKCQDAGTADFLTGLMEQHEKTAWMLRSFLEK